MSIYSLVCPQIGCYQNFQCDPEFLNKVIAVAFVKKSSPISAGDKTDPDTWKAALIQKYIDGNAVIIFNTSGDKPKPETATTSGRGMQVTKTLAKTHTLNYTDMQGVVYGNVEFYNDIMSQSSQYDFYYFTPSRIWDASGNYVTVIGDPVITAELNTYQTAEVVVTWVSKTNPLPYEFDTNTFLEGVYLIVSCSSFPDFVITESGTGTYTIPFTASLNVMATMPDLLWSITSYDDNGTNNGVYFADPTIGTLTIVFNANQLTTAQLQVSTANGCIIGQQELTINLIND